MLAQSGGARRVRIALGCGRPTRLRTGCSYDGPARVRFCRPWSTVMKALRSMLLAAGLAVAEHATARTAQVCPGPALPPTGCFTVDTSAIGGRAFEDFVVTRPGKLLVDVARRRNELARLDSSTSALYCAVNPLAAEAPSLP